MDYLTDKIVELSVTSGYAFTYTCSSIASILKSSKDVKLNLSVVGRTAPCIRDKQENSIVIIDCFVAAEDRKAASNFLGVGKAALF